MSQTDKALAPRSPVVLLHRLEREKEMEPRLSDRASVACGVKGMKLFGVRILEVAIPSAAEQEEVMRKSASMGNLASCFASGSAEAATVAGDHGYLSDGGLVSGSRRRRGGGQERKRGVPWTEEEHRTFLTGLKKLGKGDWRGISRDFVPTRTPTQVASHAQKYFLRQINPNKKKRRSSLFDVMIDETAANVKTDPKLSLKETHEATKDIDHLCHDNHLAGSPSFNTIHAVSRGIETLQPLSLLTDCNKTPNSASVNFMVETSASTNPTPTFHSNPAIFVPDLLKLSLSHPHRPIQSSAVPPLIETNNLELSIAPPRPHSLSKLPSQGVEGGIRVV